MDDVRLTSSVSGLQTSVLASWLDQYTGSPADAPTGGFSHDVLVGGDFAWSAGHAVSSVTEIASVAVVVDTLRREYQEALADLHTHLPHPSFS